MKIFNKLDEIKNIEETVIALGNFDGVHKGHRELIGRTVKAAEVAGFKSAILTFSNHPRNVKQGESPVKSILYPDDKAEIIKNLGIDYMFNIPFDEHIKNMKPTEFIHDVLIKLCNMKEAYCGFNYRFGYKAEGTPEILMSEGLKNDFGIHVLEPCKLEKQLISSSFIRELIESGQVDKCFYYLGRYYTIGGEVVVGNKIGRTIGFPTSNLVIDESMVTPSNGVYVTNCIYNGKVYPSITNVGVKPTIGDYLKNVETHIFNFDKELYGKNIRVEFLRKTRDERKFESVEELSKQIKEDCISAMKYHEKNK